MYARIGNRLGTDNVVEESRDAACKAAEASYRMFSGA
jgi:hypothetical protein